MEAIDHWLESSNSRQVFPQIGQNQRPGFETINSKAGVPDPPKHGPWETPDMGQMSIDAVAFIDSLPVQEEGGCHFGQPQGESGQGSATQLPIVVSSQEDPGCWVEACRHGNQSPSACDSMEFTQTVGRVREMLEDMGTKDHVETVVTKGEVLNIGLEELGGNFPISG